VQGLATPTINQLPERVDREAQLGQPPRTAEKLADLTADLAWRPTFAFRLGYASMKAKGRQGRTAQCANQ
jgi:hypothetical protein